MTRLAWIVMAIIMMAAVRWQALPLPVSVDLASYSVGATELLHGTPLYGAGVWDMKPPGSFLVLAGWQAVVGVGEVQLWLLGLLLAGVTLAGVAVTAHKLGGPTAAAVTGLLWVAGGSLPAFNADRMLPDSLMVAALAVMAACVASKRPAWAGIAGSVALLTKPTAVVLVAALVAWEWARKRRVPWRMMAGLAGPAAAVGLWLAATSDLGEAWYACVTYAGRFAGDQLRNILAGLAPAKLAGPMPWLVVALGVMAIPALRRYPWAGVYLVAAVIMAALPGRWWPHYYLPLVATLMVLAGVGLARLHYGWAGGGLLALAAIVAAGEQQGGRDDDLAGRIVTRGLTREATCRDLGRALAGHTVWQWGDDHCLYFYSGARPPTGMTWGDHLTYTREDLRRAHLDRVIAAAPEVVVINRRFWLAPPDSIRAWLEERYEPVGWRGWYEVWHLTTPPS